MPKGLEIERKFLIRYPEEDFLRSRPDCRVWDIVQTYLTEGVPGETRRVREIRENDRSSYIYTHKVPVSALTHEEQENELTFEEYNQLLSETNTALQPIQKRRYRIPYKGHLLEIDLYSFWNDRATLEIELESEDEAYDIPEWIDVIRELTGEAAYKNRALAVEIPNEELPPFEKAGSRTQILQALYRVSEGSLSPEDMLKKLKLEPFENMDFARIDHHRSVRQGASEVIYGASKTPDQILRISRSMYENGDRNILITRMSAEAAELVRGELPLFYEPISRIGIVGREEVHGRGCVVVACAGTSDLYVSEEAALTAETLGSRVVRLYDVGVSGIHRLLSKMDILAEARCVIAIAGMEGALASVVGGLVDCPVIAVPTSVGYGASFGGLAALLSMLNSCASGLSVVNIDNGFGAGYLANTINQMEGIKD